MFTDATMSEIHQAMEQAWAAFLSYRNFSLSRRAAFMRKIAEELESCGDQLIHTAMAETHLPEARLRGERARTIYQLESYAMACEEGSWLEARIDTANPDKTPPKPDIRKMLVPLGPVVVFGASNFPFAYSTAGGDTACALAAGCPVIVKAHPAHPRTSQIVAEAVQHAAEKCGVPAGVFTHLFGASVDVGRELVLHPRTAAVGFTGSYLGGKQLFDWANQRQVPIPVFAEMGSVNPIFILPGRLASQHAAIVSQCAASITLGVGQFCTNPGLIIGIEGEALQQFIHDLGKAIKTTPPGTMLHPGIIKAYKEKKGLALLQEQVHLVAEAEAPAAADQALPTLATVSGKAFLENPLLHQEVFGPYSLVVRCQDQQELRQVARHLEGQLTASLMAEEQELREADDLVEIVKNICGRLIMNGVPTGVEVCLSMHHGGPFPATTDSRYTSVGADGIKRFARPLAFQGWSNALLPEPLRNENPLGIWRTINNQLTKEAI